MTKKNEPVSLYVPKELHDDLVVKATLEGRSLNNYIVQVLTKHNK